MALPYPILAPILLEQNTQLSVEWPWPPSVSLGILLATYPLGLLIGSYILGKYSDQVGRRKLMIQTLAGAVLANLLSAWAIAMENLPLLVLARLMTGLCEGNISIARAMITDLELKVTKAEAFGYLSAAGYAGYLIGPLLSGLLVEYGNPVPFYLAAVISVFALVLTQQWMPETRVHNTDRHTDNLTFWSTAQLRSFIAIQFLMCFAVSSFYSFFPVLMVEKWQSSPQAISIASVSCTLAMILVSTVAMKFLVRHWRISQLYFGGMFLFSFTLVATTFPEQQAYAYLVFAACGAAIALQNSNASTWFAEHYQQLDQGRLQGSLVSIFCFANILSSSLGGWLSSISVDWVMVIGAMLALIASISFRILERPHAVAQSLEQK